MSNSQQREKVRVLLVDHTPVILDTLERMLSGYPELEVIAAVTTVDVALGRAQELEPDVVMYGFSMRLTKTVEALPQVRDAFRDCFVVASSFEPDDAGKHKALAAGMDAYVSGFELDTKLRPLLQEQFAEEN